MKILLPLITLVWVTAAHAQEQRFVHNDVKRRFIVYTPTSYAGMPHQRFPVVVNYHGGGMTAREQMLYTQMNRMAEHGNFIVVYPQGIKNDWNVNLLRDAKDAVDDIGFTEAMLDKLRQDYRVDQRRVYAAGLSRGGFFSLRIAAELPHRFAAVAVVGAAIPQSLALSSAQRRIGVMHIAGTGDEIVAFDGKPDHYMSAPASHQAWVKANALGEATLERRSFDGDKHDGTQAAMLLQRRDGVGAALVTIQHGGHTWPGADAFNVGLPLGKTSRDVDANALIWEFVSQHRLPEAGPVQDSAVRSSRKE